MRTKSSEGITGKTCIDLFCFLSFDRTAQCYYFNISDCFSVQCFFDTPGLTLNRGGYPSKDIKVRVECAWSAIDLYDVLIVIFDVHRHLNRLVLVCVFISL